MSFLLYICPPYSLHMLRTRITGVFIQSWWFLPHGKEIKSGWFSWVAVFSAAVVTIVLVSPLEISNLLAKYGILVSCWKPVDGFSRSLLLVMAPVALEGRQILCSVTEVYGLAVSQGISLRKTFFPPVFCLAVVASCPSQTWGPATMAIWWLTHTHTTITHSHSHTITHLYSHTNMHIPWHTLFPRGAPGWLSTAYFHHLNS